MIKIGPLSKLNYIFFSYPSPSLFLPFGCLLRKTKVTPKLLLDKQLYFIFDVNKQKAAAAAAAAAEVTLCVYARKILIFRTQP